MAGKWYVYSLVIVFICSIVATQTEAAVLDEEKQQKTGDFGKFEAAGQIPGFQDRVGGGDIGELATRQNAAVSFVGAIATFVTAAIIIIALIAIIVAGYIYMTAGGSAEQVSKAKTIIASALLGIVLALAAYLILRTINPELVPVQDPFR